MTRTTHVREHSRSRFNPDAYITTLTKREKWARQREELQEEEKAERKRKREFVKLQEKRRRAVRKEAKKTGRLTHSYRLPEGTIFVYKKGDKYPVDSL